MGVLCFALELSASAAGDPIISASLAERALTARAIELRLHDAPKWHALMHYREQWSGGVQSLVQDATFFLAKTGKTDPGAELAATIEALFVHQDPEARCRFQERSHWLASELDVPPPPVCDAYAKWRERLAPAGLTLVLVESFMNNPASVFGHLLIRIDRGSPGGSAALTSFAINYSADASNSRGLEFMARGVFGYLPGEFSVRPFYEAVALYGDFENRDLFEYPLALERSELNSVVRHVWELRGAEFDYYFFDDNCAFQLMSLLDVARPTLALTRFDPIWAVPVDTVRTAIEGVGLRGAMSYRPAMATRLQYDADALGEDGTRLAQDIAGERIGLSSPVILALANAERAQVLDLANDYVTYDMVRVARPWEPARQLLERILVARLEHGDSKSAPRAAAQRSPPEEGHSLSRVRMASGIEDGEAFVELGVRPTMHEITDPGVGFPNFAGLTLLEGIVRFYPEDQNVRLDRFTVVGLESLTPRSQILKPLSWKFGLGVDSRRSSRHGELHRGHVGSIEAGVGVTESLSSWFSTFALVQAHVEAGDILEGNYVLGPGVTAGALVGEYDGRWFTRLDVSARYDALGDVATRLNVRAEERLRVKQNVALRVGLEWRRLYGESIVEAYGGVDVFF